MADEPHEGAEGEGGGWEPLEPPPPGAQPPPAQPPPGYPPQPPPGYPQQPPPGYPPQQPAPGYYQQPPPGYPPQPPPGYYQQPPPGYYPYQGAWPPKPKAGSARTGPLPLHPMSLSDILDGAFKLYKANARALIAITAVFVVPVNLLSAFLQRNLLGGEGFFTLLDDPEAVEEADAFGSNLALLIAFAATVLVLPYVAGAVSRVVAASYLGDELAPGAALRATGRRWWALTAAWVLVHLAEAVGFVACILPGLLLMALFIAVAPAIVVEELGPIQGMKRSARLVKPRIWVVLGIALVSGLLASAVGSALGFVPQMLAFIVGLEWGWLLLAAGNILTAVVTTPFVAIVATLVYFDGRIRNEGLDLAMMAADISRTAGPR